MREVKTSTMIPEGERKKGAEVRRGVKVQDQKVMNKITVKAKTGRNMENQGAKNVSRLKENIVRIVKQENEAEAETKGREPDLEVERETGVEVESIQKMKIKKQKEKEDQEVEREKAHQKNLKEKRIRGGETQGAVKEKKVKAETKRSI